MNEDREINNNCNLYNKDFVGSQSVSGVQSKSHKDTLRMTSSWWLRRMGDPACMCITKCQWSEHYLFIIIDLFSLYPGLHMCKQGLPVNTGSLAACCWSRVWAAVGTVASRVTAGCWDCVILWWFVWCIDRINVNKDFLIIIWLGTFRFINVCIREIPCFKWNYNLNLDVVHESGTKT